MVQSRFTKTRDPERDKLTKLVEAKQRGDTLTYAELSALVVDDSTNRSICRRLLYKRFGDALSVPSVGWRIPTLDELVTVSIPGEAERERKALVNQIDMGRRVDTTQIDPALVKMLDHGLAGAGQRLLAVQESRRQVKYLAGGKK